VSRPHGGHRSVLEEERDFFLRSLEDLEAERAAGDIDDGDYASLRADYTQRAAEVIRQLAALDATPDGTPEDDHGDEQAAGDEQPAGDERVAGGATSGATPAPTPAAPGGAPWLRRVAIVAVAVVVAAGIGVGVAAATGARLPGQTITGSATGVVAIDDELTAAQRAVAADKPVEAARDYQRVLDSDSTDPEALTGYGAILVETNRATLVGRGVVMLAKAESVDPSYAPAYAYLGRGLVLLGDYGRAVRQLRRYLHDAPKSALAPEVRRLTSYAERQERQAAKG